MREILHIAAEWARDGREFAVATVVHVAQSAPRGIGASMIVSADGQVFGNVSGGCVDGAVYELCHEVIASGAPTSARFGIADEEAFGVGLTCGGEIEVLAWPVGPREMRELLRLAERERESLPTALALVTAGTELGRVVVVTDSDAGEGLPATAGVDAASLLGADAATQLRYDADGCRVEAGEEARVLVIPFGLPPRLVIVGAVEFSDALARLGLYLGMRVTVVDPRPVFADLARFADGVEVVVGWPDRYLAAATLDGRAAVCVLTHDAKLDVPALAVALSGSAGFVGALGSRATHDDRVRRLRAVRVPDAAIARLRSPLGLDLGGRAPEETAMSILAEVVAARYGGSGLPLSAVSGPIHATRRTVGRETPRAGGDLPVPNG